MEQERQILIVKMFFRLLDSNFSIWKYRDITEGNTLIIIKKLDLIDADYTNLVLLPGQDFDTIFDICEAATSSASSSTSQGKPLCEDYWKLYYQAKKEFEKTKKIEGFEVLNLSTLNKLWISHYDMKFLQNVTLLN